MVDKSTKKHGEIFPISYCSLAVFSVILKTYFRTKIYTCFRIRTHTEADDALKTIERRRAASVETEPRNVASRTVSFPARSTTRRTWLADIIGAPDWCGSAGAIKFRRETSPSLCSPVNCQRNQKCRNTKRHDLTVKTA